MNREIHDIGKRLLPGPTRAYDPNADQKIVGSGNEDGYDHIDHMSDGV